MEPAPASERVAKDVGLARAEALTRWTDRRLLDPLLGFVAPGVGDAIGAVLGLYIVKLALERGAPRVVVARMLLNLALDALLGAVPLLGDLGDFLYRANTRNLALLKERQSPGGALRSRSADWLLVAGALLLLLVALALPILLLAWGVSAIRR